MEKKDDAPVLRAVGVLEWTGDAGKPKTSRLVPITVFDGDQLQDGSVYLARPAPLAVESGVEYILQKDGNGLGFLIFRAPGRCRAHGWASARGRRCRATRPKPLAMAAPKVDEDETDKPALHRKEHSGDSGGSAPLSRSTRTGRRCTRPQATAQTAGVRLLDGFAGGDCACQDPDRPTLKKEQTKPQPETGYVEDLPSAIDPDRPKLERGKSDGGVGPVVTPTLVGLPADMKQAVAVSDARNKPEHQWNYSWADPADELKMKAQLESIAREALGLEQTCSAGEGENGDGGEEQASAGAACCPLRWSMSSFASLSWPMARARRWC